MIFLLCRVRKILCLEISKFKKMGDDIGLDFSYLEELSSNKTPKQVSVWIIFVNCLALIFSNIDFYIEWHNLENAGRCIGSIHPN